MQESETARAPYPGCVSAKPSSTNFWGRTLADIRTEQGISQRQLAARTGIHRSSLRRLESGEFVGDIETFEHLFRYLGYELEAMATEGKLERDRRHLAAATNPAEVSRLAARALLDLSV